jgi:hypothetical protein
MTAHTRLTLSYRGHPLHFRIVRDCGGFRWQCPDRLAGATHSLPCHFQRDCECRYKVLVKLGGANIPVVTGPFGSIVRDLELDLERGTKFPSSIDQEC